MTDNQRTAYPTREDDVIAALEKKLAKAEAKIARRDATIKALRKEVKRAWGAGYYEATH